MADIERKGKKKSKSKRQWMKEKLKKRKYQMKRGLKCGSCFRTLKRLSLSMPTNLSFYI